MCAHVCFGTARRRHSLPRTVISQKQITRTATTRSDRSSRVLCWAWRLGLSPPQQNTETKACVEKLTAPKEVLSLRCFLRVLALIAGF